MKLEKAIEILEYVFTDPWIAPKGDFADAVKLGTEALKRLQHRDRVHFSGEYSPLPGETEE